jgi:flagellar hook-basal body complex protein FliE
VGRLRNLRRQGFDSEADAYNEYAEHALGAVNLFLGLDLEFSKIFKNFNFAEMTDEEIAAVVDSMNLSEILGIDEAELGAKLFAALDEYSHSTTDETTAIQDFKELLKENIKEIRDSQQGITEKIEEIRNNLSSSVVNPMY